MNDDLFLKGKSLRLANGAFRKAWTTWWHTVTLASEEQFWEMMTSFQKEVFYFCVKSLRPPEDACHEFVRKSVTGGEWSLAEAMSFAKRYELVKRAISKGISEVVAECSDDGFGDLVDNLPILGKDFFEKCRASPGRNGFLTNAEFEAGLREAGLAVFSGVDRYGFFRNGEHYWEMFLEEKCQQFYLIKLTDEGEWTKEEEEVSSWATFG